MRCEGHHPLFPLVELRCGGYMVLGVLPVQLVSNIGAVVLKCRG